ncbi:hypothetical protein AGMMS4956_04560 [Bacteroidia bacterium]|nr:hypothetical protein AGMMS4956_04560 [Bacteroidia bacterium]
MKTIKKDFDCVQMKNNIQAKIYADTKDMCFEDYKTYLAIRLKNSPFKERMTRQQKRMSIAGAE